MCLSAKVEILDFEYYVIVMIFFMFTFNWEDKFLYFNYKLYVFFSVLNWFSGVNQQMSYQWHNLVNKIRSLLTWYTHINR
jgi:hypothetical protein